MGRPRPGDGRSRCCCGCRCCRCLCTCLAAAWPQPTRPHPPNPLTACLILALNLEQVQEFGNEEQPGVPPLFDDAAQPKEPERGAVARGQHARELVEAVAAKQQGK